MKYDFTSIIDRHGYDAIAVEGIGEHKHWGFEPDAPKEGYDFIPLWVADMNFGTAPAVTNAIIERAKHPCFGYFTTRPEYYKSIIRWHTEHHGVTGLTAEYIAYQNGVHGCITSAVQSLTQPGDAILLHSPTYLGFYMDTDGTGRRTILSPLKQDENGIWRMDYADMDRKLKENHIHLAIFCSPHNPSGRVWEREEIEKAMEVYAANDCYVVSDEIWSDLVFSGYKHTPTQMVSDWAREHVIAVYAPSKTFNLAGLIGSYDIIYGKYLRDKVNGYAERTNYCEQNVLSMHALIGAYSKEGEEWVQELKQVLEENCRYIYDYVMDNFDGVTTSMPQGTYMLFLDCTEFCAKTGQTIDEVIKQGWDVGIGWQDGRPFNGPCHIRLNAASPKSRLEEALNRMREYVFGRNKIINK